MSEQELDKISNEEETIEIEQPKKRKMSEKTRNIVEWIVCIIIAVVLTLIFRYYIATPTVVQQVSMYPTLVEDQRLMITRTFRITKKMPKRGDIVTFEAPPLPYSSDNIDPTNPKAQYIEDKKNVFEKFGYYILEISKKSYIKRVIGLPGEHVEIKDGKVYINSDELVEDYLSDDVITESSGLTDFIVPEGCLFCMGDNRTMSTDCREFGCIPFEKIEGIVVFRFWPFGDAFGKIGN